MSRARDQRAQRARPVQANPREQAGRPEEAVGGEQRAATCGGDYEQTVGYNYKVKQLKKIHAVCCLQCYPNVTHFQWAGRG